MKFVLILPDGAADEPHPDLGGRTPLEVARIPNMDLIATLGRVGMVKTVPKNFTPGSDVATLSVMGYDPEVYYTGRAPLEAAARRISMSPDELVFRCNLVTIVDETMVDFSAGHISQPEAETLLAELQTHLGNERISFHTGISYRHLVKVKDADWMKVKCTPPHDISGRNVAEYLPVGKGSEIVRELMERSRAVLADHKINQVRRDLGENPATSIWLWGAGKMPRLKSFHERFGIQGAVVAAVDLIRGISACIGWRLIDVDGATGYLDTNYHGKGQAAVKVLDEVDLVAVHVEAPDEAGHNGDAAAKVKALERVDEHIVGPLMEKLRSFDSWRVLCLPDHPTPIRLKTHTAEPVPFCMAGAGITRDESKQFTENAGRESDLYIDPGHELMEYFLKAGRES